MNVHKLLAWCKNVKYLCKLYVKQRFIGLDKETQEALTQCQMAELIKSFFVSLTSDYPTIRQKWLYCGKDLPLPRVSVESVTQRQRLKAINHNKAITGSFDPPLKIIKNVADLTGRMLCDNIINFSFSTKEFPTFWKIYDICSIPNIVSPPCEEDKKTNYYINQHRL